MAELFHYLDSLKDLCTLVYNSFLKVYEPKSSEWIKTQIYDALKNYATQ